MRQGYTRGPYLIWRPNEETTKPGRRLTATIPFANPGNIKKGFVNVTFDIDYQLIECSGELHVAYSLVDDSVRQKKPGYYLEGRHYLLANPAPPTVTSVPIKGMVSHRDRTIVGRFADDAAGKALGFGCFSGQTKKVASIADLRIGGSDKPSKDALKKYMDALEVSFETPEVLTSTSVEADIRAGNTQATNAPRPGEAAADTAAEERERRAAISAEKRAKYERELAEHNKAVADFAEAERKMEADKVANSAHATAVQEEFARQQAAHAAVLEAHRKAQAEYEAKVAAQPRN